MTVGELIKKLEKFDKDMPVLVDGDETRYDNIKDNVRVVHVHAELNHAMWDGIYSDDYSQNVYKFKAVILSR